MLGEVILCCFSLTIGQFRSTNHVWRWTYKAYFCTTGGSSEAKIYFQQSLAGSELLAKGAEITGT